MLIKIKRKTKKLKPGQKAGLTRDKIVLKAIALTENNPHFTLKDLARGLNVAPMAVRNHFPGTLSEIKIEALRKVLTGIGRPFKPHETWEEYIEDLFDSLIDAFKGRPNLSAALALQFASSYFPNAYLPERLLYAIDVAGIPKAARARALKFVLTNLVGATALCARKKGSGSLVEAPLPSGSMGAEFPLLHELHGQFIESSASSDSESLPTLSQYFSERVIAALKAQAEKAHLLAAH